MLSLEIICITIILVIGLAQFGLDYTNLGQISHWKKVIKYCLICSMILFAIIQVITIVNDKSQTTETIDFLKKLEQQANEDKILAQEREALAVENRKRIEDRLIHLENIFDPFILYSTSKYPNLGTEKALDSLIKEISKIKSSIDNSNLEHNNGIKSLLIEARLICTLKNGEELPPEEASFLPVGDSHAYFEGITSERIEFISPVYFRNLNDNKINVINRFTLKPGSTLENQSIEYLKNFKTLSVPIVTIIYGSSFEKFLLLEISIKVNGEQIWYSSWQYNEKFKVGPRFSIPLKDFHDKLY